MDPPPAVPICGTRATCRNLSVGTVDYGHVSCFLCLRILRETSMLDEIVDLRKKVENLKAELEMVHLALAKREPMAESRTST